MKQRSSGNHKVKKFFGTAFVAALFLLVFCPPVDATTYDSSLLKSTLSNSRTADVIVDAKITALEDVQKTVTYGDGRTETGNYLKVTADVSAVRKDETKTVGATVTFLVRKGETITIPIASNGTIQEITVDGVDSVSKYRSIYEKRESVIFFLKVKHLPANEMALIAKDYGILTTVAGQYDAGPISNSQQHVVFDKELLREFFDFSTGQPDTPPAWLQGKMEVLNALAIVQGYPDGLLRPNHNISREEFVTLLARVFSFYDATATCSFQDVSTGDWFYPYVASAQKAGLVKGVSANGFGAGQAMTRQDAVTLIARAIVKYQGKQLPDAAKTAEILSRFTDFGAIGDYAKASMALLVEEKLISGYAVENSFALKPANLITRAEICQILYFVKFH